MDRIYLYIILGILLTSIAHADMTLPVLTGTLHDPLGANNPSFAFDDNNGTNADLNSNIILGMTFSNPLILNTVRASFQQHLAGTAGDALIEYYDGTNWNMLINFTNSTNEKFYNETRVATPKIAMGIRFHGTSDSGNWRLFDFYGNYSSNATFVDQAYPSQITALTTNNYGLNISTYNLTIVPGINTNATLWYNNTGYPMTIVSQNTTFISFTASVTAPNVLQNSNINLNYTYFFNNQNYNTSTVTQSINALQGFNFSSVKCVPPMQLVYNFTTVDEDNFTVLPMDTIDYNFYYGTNNISTIRSYGTLKSSSNVYVCINDSISTLWQISFGELVYKKSGWVDRRFYVFNGTNVINGTLNNITLYSLNNPVATAFQVNVKSSSGNNYANVYTELIRWYPNLNSYNIVDMGLTDTLGNTITYAKVQDIDYRMGVFYSNGTLVYMITPTRMYCLTTPCSFTITVPPDSAAYSTIENLQYTFNYNNDTHIWSFVFSDPSLRTSLMNLSVWKDTGDYSTLICSNTVYGTSGAVSCNTSGYTGKLRGEIYRAASPAIPILQLFSQDLTSPFTHKFGLFITFLIAVPIIFFSAMISPVLLIFGVMIAAIVPVVLGVFSITIMGVIITLGIIMLFFINFRSGQ